MGRRIEVELTSSRDDGTWTWRAAGARQPKGVVDAGLLYEGARVGDVVRAEADFEIEGISITAVLPPKEKKRQEPARLEVIGPPRDHQGVTSSLVPKSDRPRGAGRDRDGRDGRPRRDGPGDARRGGPPRSRDAAPGTGGRPRPEGPAGAGAGAGAEGRPRPERGRSDGRRDQRGPRTEGARPNGRDRRPGAPQPEPAQPRAKRLSPANVHRAAAVESLPPEQRPIADQVLRGGIPAVRQAVEAQNARLREEGQSEVKAAPLVALAEQLLPLLKAAEWRDRAEAAVKVAGDVSLRDLRSVVAGADAARDDEGRLLAGTLRQALERRVNEQRERWVHDIAGALDEGRLVRALRLSAHPPDPSSRFPAELAVRLSDAAGAAMAPDATPDRWATLLDAVSESPVRRSVKPAGLPDEPGEALLQTARQVSGRVPALATLLGITMPPPPGPPRGARPAPRGRPAGSSPRRRPPPPPSAPGGASDGAEPTLDAATTPAEGAPGAPVAGAGAAVDTAPTPEATGGPAPETATAPEGDTATAPAPETATAPEGDTATAPAPETATSPEGGTATGPPPDNAATAPEGDTATAPADLPSPGAHATADHTASAPADGAAPPAEPAATTGHTAARTTAVDEASVEPAAEPSVEPSAAPARDAAAAAGGAAPPQPDDAPAEPAATSDGPVPGDDATSAPSPDAAPARTD